MALPLAPQRPTLSVQSATSEGQAMLKASTRPLAEVLPLAPERAVSYWRTKWRGANPIGPPSRSNRRRRPERAGDHPAMIQRHLRRRVGLLKNRSTSGGRIRGRITRVGRNQNDSNSMATVIDQDGLGELAHYRQTVGRWLFSFWRQ
jgi:hypothetical protein